MPIQRLSLALCAAEGCCVHGADVQDACAHDEACEIETHMQADDARVEWAWEVPGKDIKRGSVMEVLHSFQEHRLSGKQWMKMIDNVLIDDLGFSATTHDQCICKKN